MKSSVPFLFAGCILTLSLFVASFFETYPLEALERKTYDLRAALCRKAISSPVVVVAVDRESLRRMGPWPWPRASVGLLLHRLHEYGARVIGVELLYSAKDTNPGLQEIRDIIRNFPGDPRLLQEDGINRVFAALKDAEKRLDNDALLATALAETDNVVLPVRLVFGGGGGNEMQETPLEGSLMKSSLSYFGSVHSSAQGVLLPLREFSQHASALGHTNHAADSDGIIRSEPLFLPYARRLVPSFALQLVLRYLRYDLEDVSIGRDALRLGDRQIPTFGEYRLLTGPADPATLTVYSFSDVLKGRVPAGAFRNRLVIVGGTTPETGPFVRTPLAPELPAPLLTAATAAGILGASYVTRPSWAFPFESLLLFLLGGTLFLGSPGRDAGVRIGFALLLVIAWTGAALHLFVLHGYWLKVTYALFLPAAGIAAMLVQRLFTGKGEEEEKPAGSEVIENEELRMVVGALTDAGRVREVNEDAFCIDSDVRLLAVADGIGGHSSGEVASRMAVDGIREYFRRGEKRQPPRGRNGFSADTTLLGDSVRSAGRTIHEAARSNLRWDRMGTTLAAVLLRKNRLSIAHVGDSRVYLARAGALEQLTEDHAVQEKTMRHVLTRALGLDPDVEADLTELTLSDGDVVLLCSDGLTAMVPDNEILSALRSARDPYLACTRLVKAANARGGRDNVTVIAAYAYRKSRSLS
ncbi:MAG: CHASE2 domain-containing protein [Nitrospirales bacterium]|nr:CHASE2 domain-containing protein [Nitrospirales bacterium]